ncbi:hypothetical protein HK096_006106 [Nowakowskiella sp. JEL0078]|nr:hypothetical protein HK096_006106 [Nowakowskiella sp. JEL0078]
MTSNQQTDFNSLLASFSFLENLVTFTSEPLENHLSHTSIFDPFFNGYPNGPSSNNILGLISSQPLDLGTFNLLYLFSVISPNEGMEVNPLYTFVDTLQFDFMENNIKQEPINHIFNESQNLSNLNLSEENIHQIFHQDGNLVDFQLTNFENRHNPFIRNSNPSSPLESITTTYASTSSQISTPPFFCPETSSEELFLEANENLERCIVKLPAACETHPELTLKIDNIPKDTPIRLENAMTTPILRQKIISPKRSSQPRPKDKALPKRKPNNYYKWKPEEDELLRQAVKENGTSGKWSIISTYVPGRSAIQCSTRWTGALNTSINKGRWKKEEDMVLLKTYQDCMKELKDTDREGLEDYCFPWNVVAEKIPGRTQVQCIARYQEALDPRVKKGRWSDDEDDILRTGFEKYGCCWVKIANLISGRTQRQCRTRWLQLHQKKRGHIRSSQELKYDEECESVVSDDNFVQEQSPAKLDVEICNGSNDKENQSELSTKRRRLNYEYEFCDKSGDIDGETGDVEQEVEVKH